jgi:hypothetical protein
MDDKFSLPGSDGELDPSSNMWRKGIVLTKRPGTQSLSAVKQGYRVSVVFKRGVSAEHPVAGFHDLYQRVSFVANQRISELTPPDSNEQPASVILCHGWRLLGDTGNLATAFVTLGIGSPDESGTNVEGEQVPTDEDLRSPGGASLEDLVRLTPQRAEELYNEFDFTDASTPSSDPITVSYAETILDGDLADFTPFVERAEEFARSYYKLLKRFEEVNSRFRVTRREWFLADRRLVTVHICFSR